MYNGIYKQNYKSAKKRLLKSEDRSAINDMRSQQQSRTQLFWRVITSVMEHDHYYCCALWIFVGHKMLKLHPTLRNQTKETKHKKKNNKTQLGQKKGVSQTWSQQKKNF